MYIKNNFSLKIFERICEKNVENLSVCFYVSKKFIFPVFSGENKLNF